MVLIVAGLVLANLKKKTGPGILCTPRKWELKLFPGNKSDCQ